MASSAALPKKRSFFSLSLPRLGSKERMASTDSQGTVSRSNSKEKDIFVEEDVFEVASPHEEEKVDDDNPRMRSASPQAQHPSSAQSSRLAKKKPGKYKASKANGMPEKSKEALELEAALQQREVRRKLVEALLSLHDDLSTKVRFCCAVDEFLAAEGKDHKSKGAHIVSVFIKKGSMFHLSGIPRQYEQSLLAKKYGSLEPLRTLFLNELAQNDLVARVMQEVLAKPE